MRDRRARSALVGLIMTLPLLMVALDPKRPSLLGAVVPVLAVESVLVAGLAFAAQERARLTAERHARAAAPPSPSPSTRTAAPAPHAAPSVRRAHAGRA